MISFHNNNNNYRDDENMNPDVVSQFVEEDDPDHSLKFSVSDDDDHYDSQSMKHPTQKMHVHNFAGVDVLFFYKNPYPGQTTIMEEIIKRVENSEHSLVESQTGTGKPAALLCSLLAWQQKKYEEREQYYKSQQENGDEAHNIESFCQDVGSHEIDNGTLEKTREWWTKAEKDENLDDEVKRRALLNLKGAVSRLSNWFHKHKEHDFGFKEIQSIQNENEKKRKFLKDLTNTSYGDFVKPKQGQSPKIIQKPQIVDIFQKLGLGPEKLKGLWCSYFILLDRHNIYICRHPACNFKGKNEMVNSPEKEKAPESSAATAIAPLSLQINDKNVSKKKTANEESFFKVDQKSITFIKNFLFCLQFFYKENTKETQNQNPNSQFHHFRDYKIFLVKEEEKNPTSKSKVNFTLQFICLNPGIVFKNMTKAQTVIVASGTLSPLDSFSSKLEFNFIKAPKVSHVVPASNVFSAIITKNMESTNNLNFSWNSMTRQNQIHMQMPCPT